MGEQHRAIMRGRAAPLLAEIGRLLSAADLDKPVAPRTSALSAPRQASTRRGGHWPLATGLDGVRGEDALPGRWGWLLGRLFHPFWVMPVIHSQANAEPVQGAGPAADSSRPP